MPQLTKSLFVAGRRCHDLLWWRVHEPEAEELAPDVALEGLFEQGRRVGLAARDRVPGGVLIEAEGRSIAERARATAEALEGGARVLYEAAFLADEVFVAVDILERAAGSDAGFHLIEVKSSTSVKQEHIPDVAIQMHVLRRSGLEVDRAVVMHLNKECRYPDLEDLFVREDVTEAVEELLPEIPGEIEAQLEVLDGAFPEGGFGRHCLDEQDCPFHDRCWPEENSEHVLTLYRVGSEKKWELIEEGIESIRDLDARSRGLNKTAQRQVRSVLAGERIQGRGLARALTAQAPKGDRLAYLDFETVQRAIPVWEGCGPWAQMPVQFSCHRERKPGWPEHFEFLAESGEDCREALSEALVEAVFGDRGGGEVTGVVAYNAGFERTCLRGLAAAVPRLAGELEAIADRLVDLLPLVRNYVYDPGFLGSFGLKSVLPALLPAVTYDDLEVADGATASLYLSRLLFEPERVPEEEREPLRRKLLAYCERDTWATVRLLEKLRELGEPGQGE